MLWILTGALGAVVLQKAVRYVVTPKLSLGEIQAHVADEANVGVDKASAVLKVVREKPWVFYAMKNKRGLD